MAKNTLFILDGGLGTTLERNHSQVFSSEKTPLWSSDLLITNPLVLQACQKSFADAGAQFLETSTYQASIEGFSATKTEGYPNGVSKSEIPEFLERAVDIACSAGAESKTESSIALSIGPYGACLIPSQEYTGNYGDVSEDQLRKWHLERLDLFSQIKNLAERIQIVAVETIPKTSEIKILRRALSDLRDFQCFDYWVSCLYPNDDLMLPSGESAESAVRAMLSNEYGRIPWGVGINCTKVRRLERLIDTYALTITDLLREGKVSEWPALVLYPDGTAPEEIYNTSTQKWEVPDHLKEIESSPWSTQMAEIVRRELERGVWKAIVVGGCCCTDPMMISELSEKLS